jgi:hypothetical protein
MEIQAEKSGTENGATFALEQLAIKVVNDPSAILCGGCVNTGGPPSNSAGFDTTPAIR